MEVMECLKSLAPQPYNIPDVDVGILMVPPLCLYLTQRNRIIQSKLSSTTHELFFFTIHRTSITKGWACG